MRVVERERHELEDARGLIDLELLAARVQRTDELEEGRAVHPLEREEVAALVLAELVEPRDVRVADLRGDARLVDEHADEGRIVRGFREHALDGDDAAARADGARAEDLAHA